MSHLSRCCALSLTLHLAAVALLFLTAPLERVQAPNAITVVLDSLLAPDLTRQEIAGAPMPTGVRPVQPAISARQPVPAAAQHEPLQASQTPLDVSATKASAPAVPEPALSGKSAAELPPERNSLTEAPKPDPGFGDTGRMTAGAGTNPLLVAPAVTMPVTEKARQLFLKEQLGYIRELITKRLFYPPLARRMNWSGQVVVAFSVAEDGSVDTVRVTESSGFPILDQSALETVRRVAPFPKPPVRVEIVVPISFKMMPMNH